MSTHKPIPGARKGKANRVYLGVRIDPATSSQLAKWQEGRKVSQGVLVDRLTAHALRTKFNPAQDIL